MNLCIIAGERTEEICTYLQTNYRDKVSLSVWFPKEKRFLETTDIVLFEKENSALLSQILSMEEPPLIVILKEGISTKNIRYITELSRELPDILASVLEKEPVISLVTGKETYVYPQKDVVSVLSDGMLQLTLRTGRKAVLRHGFRRLLESLSPVYFFRVGDKALVNVLYVAKFQDDGVLMENGDLISCTPEQLKRAENAFFKLKLCQNLLKKES